MHVIMYLVLPEFPGNVHSFGNERSFSMEYVTLIEVLESFAVFEYIDGSTFV